MVLLVDPSGKKPERFTSYARADIGNWVSLELRYFALKAGEFVFGIQQFGRSLQLLVVKAGRL